MIASRRATAVARLAIGLAFRSLGLGALGFGVLGLGVLGFGVLGGCVIRTPGSFTPERLVSSCITSTADGPSPHAVAPDRLPDPIPGPTWRAPDPRDPKARQPRGFAVLGPDRQTLTLDRCPDAADAELWRPRRPLSTAAFAMIDASRIATIEPWIAVLELADDDPARRPEIPARRAVDGLLAHPATHRSSGLAIILGSLARLNPPEQWLVAEFLERGWSVLVSSPPVCAPDDRTHGVTTLAPGMEPEAAGSTLAAEVDAGLGTWRDGLRAIITHLAASKDLPDGPTVLVGASSGALAAPVIADALRQVRPVGAVALIAGGASPAEILARTTLADDDLRLDRRGPRVDDVDLPRFIEAFESSSRLQSPASERTAAERLAGIPIILLEPGFDSAIPARARSRLRGLHPQATHWWYPLGHYGLFIALATESAPLVDWLEWAVHPDSDGEGAAAAE